MYGKSTYIENMIVTKATILESERLITKAFEELRLSEDPNKSPTELLCECIKELEDKSFFRQIRTEEDDEFTRVY